MSTLLLTRARLRTEDARIGALVPLLAGDRNPLMASHHRAWSLMSDGPDRTRDFLFRDAGDITFVLSDRAPEPSSLERRPQGKMPSLKVSQNNFRWKD